MAIDYEDLLAARFKWGGRGDGCYDCWGLVMECCARAGTPVADPFTEKKAPCIRKSDVEEAIAHKLNIAEAECAKEGRILYWSGGAVCMAGYMVTDSEVLHMTAVPSGARVTSASFFKGARFFDALPLQETEEAQGGLCAEE